MFHSKRILCSCKQQINNNSSIISSLLLTGSFCLMSLLAFAQTFESTKFPVLSDGEELLNPFTGGIDSPQVISLDLDRDGFQDLVIFDRQGGVFLPYLYDGENGTYHYEDALKNNMPPLTNFVIQADYNQDGIEDLFGQSLVNNGQTQVYEGRVENGTLLFEEVNILNEEDEFNILYSKYFNNRFPLAIPITDIPSILDYDGDGDIDILTFDTNGSRVELHLNMDKENGNPSNTFEYKLADFCLGGMVESGMNADLILSEVAGDCARDGEERHAGSTLLSLDFENDGDWDLLIGDLSSKSITAAYNNRQGTQDWFDKIEENFPSDNVSIDLPIFISTFLYDVDKDGKEDLLAGPNNNLNGENINNLLLYTNVAEEGFDLRFQQSDFLVDTHLDFGSFSSPEFVDVNQDGLMDLVVATKGKPSNNMYTPALFYYKNTGTLTNPVFELEDDDYLGFSQFALTGIQPSIGFGDVDGDADIDLIIAFNNGKLFYYENTAGEGNVFNFASPIYPFMDIQIGSNVKPEIYDLNGDGLGDLILGEKNGNSFNDVIGSFNYFQNVGTLGDPQFIKDPEESPNTPILGEALIIENSKSSGSPIFVTSDNQLFLFSGSELGGIRQWLIPEGEEFGTYELISENLGNIKEGRRTDIDMVDIDNDGWYDMVVGGPRGGISLFKTDIRSNVMVNASEELINDDLSIYPNPVLDQISINNEGEGMIEHITVYAANGTKFTYPSSQNPEAINVKHLPAGVYYLKCMVAGTIKTLKFVKI